MRHDFRKQGFLVLEMTVKRCSANTGLLGNIFHAGTTNAFVAVAVHSGFKEVLPGAFTSGSALINRCWVQFYYLPRGIQRAIVMQSQWLALWLCDSLLSR